jgi:hypothetical protein
MTHPSSFSTVRTEWGSTIANLNHIASASPKDSQRHDFSSTDIRLDQS